ncbi:hypothetical protein BGZ63DRAFT_409336 [Mariannaea sp. PMI_226]|nr:hypothetical protein BGZ63DRAFT_409336 [Mariannaea sp. PMI_226]
MATFVRSFPPLEELPLPTGFDATKSTLSSGCLIIPPFYGTSIDSPECHTKMVLDCGMNHSPISSFSGKITSTPSISSQMGCSFPPYSIRTTTVSKSPEDLQSPEGSLPTHYNQHNELYQRQNFVLPSGVSSRSEEHTPKTSKDVPNGRTRGRTRGEKRKGEQKGANKKVKKDNSSTQVRLKDSRRQLILERNKLAAIKCRKRKQDEESALAACEQEMEQCNGQLKKEFDELTAETYYLKAQLLRHTDCSCTLIQRYMAHEVRKSVDILPPPLRPFQPKSMLEVEHPLDPNGSGDSGSLTSITHSYGNQTPGLENEPPIWSDLSLIDTSSLKTMLCTTMDLTQNEYIPSSSELLQWMPSTEGFSYPQLWTSTGASFPVIELNIPKGGIGDPWGRCIQQFTGNSEVLADSER